MVKGQNIKTVKQQVREEYFSMARSLYNRLKSEGYELGRGSISNIATSLARMDRRQIEQNYREKEMLKFYEEGKLVRKIPNANFEPLDYTALGMYYNYKRGYDTREDYLHTLKETFTEAQKFYYEEERKTGIEINQRFKGFLKEFGNFKFRFSLTGQTKTMKEWVNLYKKGKINLNTMRDIMDEFKHSNVYEEYTYNGKR